VVRTPDTSQQALAAGLAFVRQIGKLPLPCRSRPGFLVNRILAPYLAEAMALAREGHALAQIDQAAVDFGMPMGPIELADSVGLDIALSVARTLAPILGREVDPQLEQKVQAGQLGVKTGQGFYQYRERRPVKPPGRGMISGEIEERLVLALLNEAAHCLAEGIVDDADLVDAGVIFGTGFAPFRGGPLHYASARGIDEIVVRLGELSSRLGPRFSPSPGWQKLKSATG
jgi:3-hydroxyacyl-CoA dehydrogenase/enoyl-CoA hydratase/3-hydroxybutyryl-CoA epimerase